MFTSAEPATTDWLKRKFPDDCVLVAPWDKPRIAERFFENVSPKLVLLLRSAAGFSEQALLLAANRTVPVILLNASLNSAIGVSSVLKKALTHVCAQDEAAAKKIAELMGPEHVSITGSLEFAEAVARNRAGDDYLRRELRLSPDALVIIFEKPSRAEESLFIETILSLQKSHSNLVTLCEPRTRRQLKRLTSKLTRVGMTTTWRSHAVRLLAERKDVGTATVLMLDQRGELPALYSIAAAIVAGGSFSRRESFFASARPISHHAPVVVGPYPSENASALRRLIDNAAVVQTSATTLLARLQDLLTNPEAGRRLTERAQTVMSSHANAAEKTVEAIARWVPVGENERPVGQGWRIEKIVEAESQSDKPGLVESSSIESWEAFVRRVGKAEWIFCLGNGPSSENPEVLRVEHDCLFRVNWRWMERGILTSPQVVFVGDVISIAKIPLQCIFVFLDSGQEARSRRSSRIIGRETPFEFFTADKAPFYSTIVNDFARPSNGALMVATAVAMAPKRLTLAGFDLFSHPDGRYPGDLRGLNQYAQVHDPDNELAIIDRALRSYRGELRILSPILRESLRQRKFPEELHA